MTQKIEEIKLDKLKEGCLLASIAHAVMVGKYPELSNEHSWDGINYSTQDSAGCRGTITFFEDKVVAVFQDYNQINYDSYTEDFIYKNFEGADYSIIEIAQKEALQYVLEDVNGKVMPYISTAFWGDKEQIWSNSDYKNFMKKSGHIIENHMLSLNESLDAWQEYYDMSQEQRNLVESLFNKKILIGDKDMVLTKGEVKKLVDFFGEDICECEESLNELSIYLK